MNYRKDVVNTTVAEESEMLWRQKEEAEAKRIEKETALAWAEYDEQEKIIEAQAKEEIAEYFNGEENDETLDLPKNSGKHASRRKSTARVKRRLKGKAEIASKSLRRRVSEDTESFVKKHETEVGPVFEARSEKPSKAARASSLIKKAAKNNC